MKPADRQNKKPKRPIDRLKKKLAKRNALLEIKETIDIPKKRKPRLTFDMLMAMDDNETVEIRTGLTRGEFDNLLELLSKEPREVKRGMKLLSLEVRLVIILQWLHFGETFAKLGNSFKLDPGVIQTCISDLWNPLEKVLVENYLPKDPRAYKVRDEDKFVHHPDAVGALDATLIPVVKPRIYKEYLKYLSGKHRRCGVKMQALVAPDGQCIHYGGLINGARNDLKLYEKSNLHIELLRMERQGTGTLVPTRPAILADGGYLGIHNTYPEAIIPRRKPKGRLRPEADIQFNKELSSDRIIVERYFARLKGTWGILQKPYRSDKRSLDVLAKILVCLTNMKIKNAPMYATEKIFDPHPVLVDEEGLSPDGYEGGEDPDNGASEEEQNDESKSVIDPQQYSQLINQVTMMHSSIEPLESLDEIISDTSFPINESEIELALPPKTRTVKKTKRGKKT